MLASALIAQLNAVQAWEDYAPLQGRASVWGLCLQEIARRHDLPEDVTLFNTGTHITGATGDAVIKLFLPFWRDFEVEAEVLARLEARAIGVRTPKVLAQGALVPRWSYVVMTRLPGDLLSEVQRGLSDKDRERLLARAGEVLFAFHQVEGGPLATTPEWSQYARSQREEATARQRDWGLPAHLCAGIQGRLDALKPLYLGGLQKKLLHGDFTARQCLVEGNHLTGLIDFGDALFGHYEYDLAAASAFLGRGNRGDLRAFLMGYGFPSAALTRDLAARLLGWLLLHHHGDITWLLRTHFNTNARALKSWDHAQAVLFPLP